jgi:hypothetical protein
VKTKLAVSSAICLLLCCSAVQAQWPLQTWGVRPSWEAEIGGRILDRPGTDDGFPLVTDTVTLETVFDSEEATDLDVSGGPVFRFQHTTCYDTSWEVRGYFNNWDILESRSGNIEAINFTPQGLPQSTRLTAFDYAYDSELFSIELNFKRAVHPGVTLMIGPRFMNLEEVADIDANFFNPQVGDFLQIETLAETKNPMTGLNLGLELRKPLSRDFFAIASVRGGIFHNVVTSRITVANTLFGQPDTTTILIDDRENRTAGIAEISGRLHFDLIPGSVSFFTGYEAMWLDGVAIAPAQILAASTPPDPPFINTATTIFAHGVVIGGMVRF